MAKSNDVGTSATKETHPSPPFVYLGCNLLQPSKISGSKIDISYLSSHTPLRTTPKIPRENL